MARTSSVWAFCRPNWMIKSHLELSAAAVPTGPSQQETQPSLKWPPRKSEGSLLPFHQQSTVHGTVGNGEVERRGLGKAKEIREWRLSEDSLL